MEVHHHAHTARKKWTHYLWEFLMLFLAVFCGFLAENQREHIVEHRREKQYIITMIEDLKADTLNLEFVIQDNKSILTRLDSLRAYFDEIGKGFDNVFFRNLSGLQGFEDFHPADRTLKQLKNAGNMRLIRKMNASDSIMTYDAAVQDVQLETTSLGLRYEHISMTGWEIFNYRKMSEIAQTKGNAVLKSYKESLLLADDKLTLGKYYNEISEYRGLLFTITGRFDELKNKATRLMAFLKKEYHLK